jgi:hypothetical protein
MIMNEPKTGYNPETAMEIAKSIVFAPRLTGSGEEKEAQAIIEERLRQADFQVERQEFSFSEASSIFLRIFILVMMGFIIIILFLLVTFIQGGGGNPWPGVRQFFGISLEAVNKWVNVGMAGLCVVTLFLLGLSNRFYHWVRENSLHLDGVNPVSWGKRFCKKIGTEYTTANLVAKLNRNGTDEVEADRSEPDKYRAATTNTPPLLILVAHTDTKSQNISLVWRIGLFSLAMPAALVCAMAILLATLESYLVGQGFLESPMFWQLTTWLQVVHWIGVLSGSVAIISSIPLLFLVAGNESPGAIDNASGVGVITHLAEIYASKPEFKDKFDLEILVTSAEELNTMGALAYVQQNKVFLRRRAESTWLFILNLDGPGVEGKMYWSYAKTSRTNNHQNTLHLLVKESCEELGVPLRNFWLPGAKLDHMPFAELGFSAGSIIGIGKASRRVHTPRDVKEILQIGGFRQSGEAIYLVMEKISRLERG